MKRRKIFTLTLLKSSDETGANLVEYALLVALVAGLSVVLITNIGRSMADIFCYTAGKTMTGDPNTEEAAKHGGKYDWNDGCCKVKTPEGVIGDDRCL